MNTLFPHTFVSPTLPSTILCFAIGLLILLVLVAISTVISLVIISALHIFCQILCRASSQEDIEAGRVTHEAQTLNGNHGPVRSNQQILEILDRIIRELGENRRGSLQQQERIRKALERLPPRVCYGSHEAKLCSLVKECPICLEGFKAGDFCQVIPVCDHFFHSDCLGNWLRKIPTCPLCRICLLESDCENKD